MRAQKLLTNSEGSLLGAYTSRMSEYLWRRRADLETQAARKAADSAIKARSEFLANMNHELRTPLNAIIGFATMLRDGEEFSLGPERRNEYAEYILQSADLLLGHINTILEIAALESGDVEFVTDDMEIGTLLDDAIARCAIRAEAGDIKIVRRDEGVKIAASGDQMRAGQALDHVIQTAIDACEEGGRIMVRAALNEDGKPEIAVRDEGAGFSKDEIDAALNVFAETQLGLDRTFSGAGVGYAIAKSFIELQGGAFSVKSRPGQGTLVRLVFADAPANGGTSAARSGEETSDAA
ncbi:MAG: HAMP domain-containing sensor histidine kinase [Pseudomonadota bacterium]